MSTLWLALSPTAPVRPDSVARVLWCPPGGLMVPLCHALYAAEADGQENPLIISTPPALPAALTRLPLPDRATAFLAGPDDGALFFPSAIRFRQYAREAIRAHNPETGPLTLAVAWQQVCLTEGYPYDGR